VATDTLTTVAAQVTSAGISAPTYADILAWLQSKYRGIYGSDIYLEADSQDGQWLAILASAFNDVNSAAISVYNAFSPATAKGAGLSSVVKINGISKNLATNSTVDVTIVGELGTVIINGQVGDDANNKWALPSSVTIPLSGSIVVTAVCTEIGAIAAPAATVTEILTPTRGWQSVTNVSDATKGAPVESDAALRQRQAKSVALPALTSFAAVVAAVTAVPGVTRLAPYENDTGSTDGNGQPAHSLAMVVEGGDAQAVATAIAAKKAPGVYTYGSTSETVADPAGVLKTIRFYRPTDVSIQVGLTIKALTGYTTAIGAEIKAALVAYINALPIGEDVLLTRLYVPAQLGGAADGLTYEVTGLLIAKNSAMLGSFDITILFNEAAIATTADITLTVIP
jgi:uncharacterized phage protein gp47/JayE